jgi:4-amino-4-deoxy-L-arabinose transferase-like glycosyltransferase
LLALPLERDEGEFAYNGQLILQGIPPFKLAFNMKMPGIYVAYAIMMALFGQSPTGIHLGFLLVNLANLALLFLLARPLLAPGAVPVTCAAFVLLSLSPAVLGVEGHATNFVILFAQGGFLLFLRARPTGSPLLLVLGGVCFGLAFLCKQPGLFFGLFAAVVLARDALVARPVSWGLCLRKILFLGFGLVLPLALTCLWLWRAGTLGRFWFWTFPYARVYGSLQSLPDGLDRLREFFESGCDRWFYLTGTIGLLALFWRKAEAERRFFFSAFFACSFLATAAGLYFRGHYFILMLPVLCLLIGDFLAWLPEELSRRGWVGWSGAPSVLFIVLGALMIWENRGVWFEWSMAQATKAIYLAEGFVECQEIGNYIRTHAAPEERVAVIGSEPEIYFYAQRHSASGYIYMYDLVRNQPYAPGMRREFMEDVERSKPKFLVVVNVGTSWMPWLSDVEPFIKWVNQYPSQYYELAGVAEVDQHDSAYFWDQEGMAKHRGTPTSILLYRRK